MTGGNSRELLAIVLADPVLRAALVELCRTDRCRTRGRKIIYRVTQVEPGRLKVEEEIAAKHEPIPPDDWAGRDLLEWPEGLRLEGAVEYAGIPEGHFVHKGWTDVTFDTHILRALVEAAQQPPVRKGRPPQPKVTAWLKDRIATWPEDKAPPTEADDLAAARGALGDVRRAQLRDAVDALNVA